MKSLVIHTGALDVVKQQSELLKQDFTDLMNKVQCMNTEVFFSGSLPNVPQAPVSVRQLLSSNFFYFVCQTPAAPAKDKKQDNPKQLSQTLLSVLLSLYLLGEEHDVACSISQSLDVLL